MPPSVFYHGEHRWYVYRTYGVWWAVQYEPPCGCDWKHRDFSSLGLGTTVGGLNSSAINYQKALGNPVSTLGAIRDAQHDLSKRWQFQAMGINNPDQDPAKLLPQMIRNARDIFVKMAVRCRARTPTG